MSETTQDPHAAPALTRRGLLQGSTALLSVAALPAWGQIAASQTAAPLIDLARAMQAEAYHPNTVPLSPPFADLDYDAFRGIRPIPGQTAMIPHGEDFAFDLLPPGLYFPDPVIFDRMTPDGPSRIAFAPTLFSYEPRYFGTDIPATSPGAGFTGLRLRTPLNSPDLLDEVLVVQGASYFRAIGRAMVYGLSARAVALGTGGAAPEEFPRFVHVRLHPADGGAVRLEGVFDGPSLSGHLDLTLRPGADTTMEIAATLFPRVDIADIGIAPLTSMYLKGPLLAAVSDDFRPRVHDSDVLVIENGAGEVLWRPISNPARIETSAFRDRAPRRFGLFQTPRRYADFEDTEARYHDRPSAYVEPLESWGEGHVMLVELPTVDEFMDNIVAFWRPEAPLGAGREYRFAYRLTWTREPPDLGGLPPIVQSRSGQEHDRPGHRRFVIDVASSDADSTARVSASPGSVIDGISSFALPEGQGTRITFLFAPGTLDTAEIRVVLEAADGAPRSPVWLHRWTRKRDGGV